MCKVHCIHTHNWFLAGLKTFIPVNSSVVRKSIPFFQQAGFITCLYMLVRFIIPSCDYYSVGSLRNEVFSDAHTNLGTNKMFPSTTLCETVLVCASCFAAWCKWSHYLGWASLNIVVSCEGPDVTGECTFQEAVSVSCVLRNSLGWTLLSHCTSLHVCAVKIAMYGWWKKDLNKMTNIGHHIVQHKALLQLYLTSDIPKHLVWPKLISKLA